MNEPFSDSYAGVYDLLYRDKDYVAECDLVERQMTEHASRDVTTILDLGCGTGRHARIFAERGFEVLGVDRSAAMLQHARTFASDRLIFELADIRDFKSDRRFDAVVLMFAVLSYQVSNDDVRRTLRTAAGHLEPGGVLVGDVWYGPAVLTQRPEGRVATIADGHDTVIRAADSVIDQARHTCTVNYRTWRIADGTVEEDTSEHVMRFFFPLELELFLEGAGLRLLDLSAYPETDRPADETTWNATFVAGAPT